MCAHGDVFRVVVCSFVGGFFRAFCGGWGDWTSTVSMSSVLSIDVFGILCPRHAIMKLKVLGDFWAALAVIVMMRVDFSLCELAFHS